MEFPWNAFTCVKKVAFFIVIITSAFADFVLETKQVYIPGVLTACNPSIVRIGNDFLLSFNAHSEDNLLPDRMGLVLLDEEFNVKGESYILSFRHTWQDARLVSVGNQIYIVSNGAMETGIRRTFVTKVHAEGDKICVGAPECLLYFPGMRENQSERNWIPFTYLDSLLVVDNLIPHRVLRPLLGTNSCEEISSTTPNFPWEWGIPRGGTAAHLDGDHYLAFFHSSKKLNDITQYFMGAYTFADLPPFALTSISPSPIVGEDFYIGAEYKMVKPLLVVFPCGFVFNDDFVWVVYGKQDHEVWVVKVDKKGLYESLVPIKRDLQE